MTEDKKKVYKMSYMVSIPVSTKELLDMASNVKWMHPDRVIVDMEVEKTGERISIVFTIENKPELKKLL